MQDYDRPLNDRGMKDAPIMARRLKERKISVDAFVSSTANRAFTTAVLFAKEYNVKEKDILKIPKLYHAMPSSITEVIEQLNDKWHTVALFTHNPGITEFINMVGVARIDNMPTCGVFGLHLLDDSWSNFSKAEKRFWLFDYPKNL